MAKHLNDVDEERLSAAQAELGTATEVPVNEALRQATAYRDQRVAAALDRLGAADLDRADAWR